MKPKLSSNMKTSLLLLATASAFPAMASAVEGVEFKVSGQINRAVTFADNGTDSDTLFVDNNNSGTRLRLKGKVDLENGTTAGVYWETQYQDNSSGAIDIDSADNSSTFTSRIREVWFKGGWGQVYLGQGNGAANGTSETDFSGTGIADYSGNNLDDGISFADGDGNKIVTNGRVFTNFDGLSRNDRLRYDLPAFGPLSLAVSVGQDRKEFAARYNSKFGGTKVGASLGWVDNEDNFTQIGASASILTASGFNVTVHFGDRDLDANDREDPSGVYAKVGQKFGVDNRHMVSASFQQVDDLNQDGDEATRFGLQYLHIFPKQKVELYAAFSSEELDRTSGPELDTQTLFSFGSRIKF